MPNWRTMGCSTPGPEAGEIAVATIKDTTQVAVLDLLAVYLARRLGRLDDQRYPLVKAIEQFPSLVQRAIDLNPNLPAPGRRSTTDTMTSSSWAGTWTMLPAWRVAETEGRSPTSTLRPTPGELKHGTIALIEKDRPVIALACYERLFDKMMSNIKEVKARGAQVLAVALRATARSARGRRCDLRPADRAPL